MKDYMKKDFIAVIVGDSQRQELDGKIISYVKKDTFDYDINLVNQAISTLNNLDYDIDNTKINDINDAGFYLIKQGHVLISNEVVDKNNVCLLYLPNNLTEGQRKALISLDNYFNNTSAVVQYTINETDKELLDVITYDGNFNISELVNNIEKPKVKTLTK